ncbi:hypothetical protein XENORESO_010138 [Xenotaenia resolanae]|uniref:Uncharacterized protein n=1 Tax=Xenotaenia resolanae TaxID=208358 RepID=A0ABV0VQ25_9TELE
MYSTTRKRNTGYQQKYLPPTIKHCGRRVMIRTCVAAIGPGHLSDDRELLCTPKDSKDKCRLKVGPNRVINRTMNPKCFSTFLVQIRSSLTVSLTDRTTMNLKTQHQVFSALIFLLLKSLFNNFNKKKEMLYSRFLCAHVNHPTSPLIFQTCWCFWSKRNLTAVNIQENTEYFSPVR